MTDEQVDFLARIHSQRAAGAQALLRGAEPDPLLLHELRTPGADQRHGVNLILRPPPRVTDAIQAIQERLRVCEPNQYFYPAPDLHITLVEICSSRPASEAESVVAAVTQALPHALQAAPQALLLQPLLGYDRRACVLHFLPADRALQALRRHLAEQLAAHAITVAPRYASQSVHITFMRYLRPLQTEPGAWLEALESIAPETTLEWRVDALWLAWGATWYGMQGRMHMRGPYPLSPA